MKSGVLIVAIVLIAIGVVSLAYQGITTPRGRRFWRSVRSRRPPRRRRRSRSRRSWAGSPSRAASSSWSSARAA